jgi:XTP/dITP diphosphohydrolase
LILASHNVHKIREFRSILKGIKNLDLLSLLDFPNYLPLEEDGSSFEEIAVKKAIHAARTLKQWVIADDSGLVVPALDGQPGIHSARYAGPGATDKDKRHKLLKEMAHFQDPLQRQAYFECCIAIASPQGLQKTAHGVCEGTISFDERGGSGFGYDSLFVKHEYSKTFAELDESIKNRISHRRKALDKLLPHLESIPR